MCRAFDEPILKGQLNVKINHLLLKRFHYFSTLFNKIIMKKIVAIASLLCFFVGFSQNEVGKKVREYEKESEFFKPVSVLTPDGTISKAQVNVAVDNSTLAKINLASVNDVVANQYDFIELSIPYNGAEILVSLYRVNLFTEDFQIDTDKAKNIEYTKGVYYRGIIKGDYTSIASFNFFNNEFNGVFSSSSYANVVIGKLDKPNNSSDYIVYSDAFYKGPKGFECSYKDEDVPMQTQDAHRDVLTTRCVTVYFEIDYNLYQSNGNSTTTTTNWMTSVFNNTQTLYTNESISTALKSMFIWTTQDPYTGADSGDYLGQFNEVRPVFNGDVGQLVGIDPGGLGGVAVTINGLCSQNNFSYSDVNFSYSTVPTYSWTIMVVTHELGHLLGSRHTHACAWNGNNTAIDNCGPIGGGTSEGSTCVTTPPTIPSVAVKGTIMSYCHLTSSGIALSNGFGPQPAAAITAAVNAGTCLSTNCVNTCINLVTDINAQNVTNTTATIAFSELGSATAWQKAVIPFTTTTNTWTTILTPTFSATGLTANTYYKARLRPTCPLGVVSATREGVFATTADYCNGITITDTGGSSGNYTDNESFVRVLSPNVANQNVTLTFSAFSLELDYDYLYIYDGNSTSATLLTPGGLTGNAAIPGPYTSTAADGSLTMRFYSDQGVVDTGWVAATSCSTLKNNEFDGIDFTYFPNPTNGNVAINSKTVISQVAVYNVTGQLLYQNVINELNANVDISAFASGTYFFKLKFDGDREVNFKVIRK